MVFDSLSNKSECENRSIFIMHTHTKLTNAATALVAVGNIKVYSQILVHGYTRTARQWQEKLKISIIILFPFRVYCYNHDMTDSYCCDFFFDSISHTITYLCVSYLKQV